MEYVTQYSDAQRKEYCEYLLAQCQTGDGKSNVKVHDNTTRSVASKYCPVHAKFWALNDKLPKKWALQGPEQSARVAPAQNQPSSQAVEVKRDGSRNIFQGGEFIISGEEENAVCAIKIDLTISVNDDINTIGYAFEGSGDACDMMLASYHILRSASDKVEGVAKSVINEIQELNDAVKGSAIKASCSYSSDSISYNLFNTDSCDKAKKEVIRLENAKAEYYNVVKVETEKMSASKSLKSTNYKNTKRYVLARETAKKEFNMSYNVFDIAVNNLCQKETSLSKGEAAEIALEALRKSKQ